MLKRVFTAAVVLVCLIATATSGAAEERPNFLLIIADDLGYGDLGCYGSRTIATPHIDRLAAEGVKCTQGYVPSSVCSPSRAGIMTGRDPRRFGYEDNLNKGPRGYATRPALLGLPSGEHTIADHLRAAGYATALVGKWHLGTTAGFHPNERGFDHFCGMLRGGHDYFPTRQQRHSIERNGAPVEEFSSAYLTDFFTDEAIRWIDSQTDSTDPQPWLTILSYNAPHTPMQATEADLEACAHISDRKRRTYAAMVRGLDRGVGRVLDRLEELRVADRTVVVFISDNGGATSNASWNGPLAGAKGTLREGGVRVPTLWRWPSRLPAGRTHDAPVSALDIQATFLAAAGAEPLALSNTPSHADSGNRRAAVRRYGAYDGVDLTAALAGETAPGSRTLFWRLQGQAGVLSGDYKLVRPLHRPAQLFRPGADPGERDDLAATDRESLERLFGELSDWETTLTTVPLWGSSPRWWRETAKHYEMAPRPEPQ